MNYLVASILSGLVLIMLGVWATYKRKTLPSRSEDPVRYWLDVAAVPLLAVAMLILTAIIMDMG